MFQQTADLLNQFVCVSGPIIITQHVAANPTQANTSRIDLHGLNQRVERRLILPHGHIRAEIQEVGRLALLRRFALLA